MTSRRTRQVPLLGLARKAKALPKAPSQAATPTARPTAATTTARPTTTAAPTTTSAAATAPTAIGAEEAEVVLAAVVPPSARLTRAGLPAIPGPTPARLRTGALPILPSTAVPIPTRPSSAALAEEVHH